MTSLTDKIDKLFEQWDKPDSPGCALGIIKDGKLVYTRGYGTANLEHNIPISSKTVFRIGSTSKQFTTMCIALLVEQGKVSLNDDIRKYFPELPEFERPITINHLVYHTSGFPDYLGLARLASGGAPSTAEYNRVTNILTEEDILELLARQKSLNFPPGEAHLYSNSGYVLLAILVKRVSGMSLRKFADENIFASLGMKTTHFHDDFTMIVKNRAAGYSPKEDNGFFIDMTTCNLVGDGGIFTTVEDLLLWDQNFYRPKTGGSETIKLMLTPGTLNNGEKCDHGEPGRYYAFGLVVGDYRGVEMVSHAGGFVGFRAEMIRFPEQKCSIICLANLSAISPTDLALRVADIYLAEHFPEKKPHKVEIDTISLPEEQLKEKVQVYRSLETGTICELSLHEGKLLVEALGFNFPLIPVSPTQFQAVGAPVNVHVTFEPATAGKPLRMHIDLPGLRTRIYEAVKPVTLTPAQQAEYAGEYYSEELQTTYRVIVKDNNLMFAHKNASKKPLVPILEDEFGGATLNLKFTRNDQDKVTTLIVSTDRVKNKQFVKQA